jgi:hypothetical protein
MCRTTLKTFDLDYTCRQHGHLRRESQSHAPAHVLMRFYPIDKSLVFCKAKEGRHARIYNIV